MDFSAAEKEVKYCMLLRLLSGMSFCHFGELWPICRSHLGKKFCGEARWQSELAAVWWWGMHLACKHTCFTLTFAVFLLYARVELLFISLQGFVWNVTMAEYHVSMKSMPILHDFSLFSPTFGCPGNVRYTFAIRHIVFGLTNHENPLL